MKRIDFTEDDLNKIKVDYISGESVTNIARSFGCSVKVIYNKLHKMGVRPKGKRLEVSQNLLKKMKLDYELYGKTISQIADEYGLSSKVVTIRFKEMNVCFRKGGVRAKYSCNENYFNVINTPDKAYWLGFIYADGCVTRNYGNYVFQLSLKASDSSHLKKFQTCVESDHKVYDRVTTDGSGKEFLSSTIQFYSSPRLCERLVEIGVKERKSLTLEFPSSKIIPDELMSHFIRGYFDGDGCLSPMKKGLRNTPSDTIYVITFVGTISVLKGIIHYLPLGDHVKIRPHGNAFELRFGGKQQLKQVLDYMYSGAEVFLGRKRKRFEGFLSYLNQVELHTKYIVLTNEQADIIKLIFEKYLELNTINNVKRFLNNNDCRTFRGNLFSSKGICDILRNESYRGDVLVEDKLVNIISPDVFEKVQKQLDKNRDDTILRTRNMVQFMKNKSNQRNLEK
ncbi:recombinase family protein [Halalkalibacter kiskunsagensis]|uniref:Recombinase family protein n=1 Tax=Halalkalibacter kiskunsagensis TaxID=1548599 RepID=A0ABV6KHM6_9BACI